MVRFALFIQKISHSEDTRLPILWVGGAYTTLLVGLLFIILLSSPLGIFHFGRLPFWSLPFWSSSILVVLNFGRLPFWSSSIFVVFHFGRLPFWSSSILVVFHFGQSLILLLYPCFVTFVGCCFNSE